MRYRLIDAFTDQPFAGNPAAVFLLDRPEWPDTDWMQRLALEMSVPESAFAFQLPTGGDADWALRWFTPQVEDELCGHATLAVAHALHTDRGGPGTVRFQTRSGILTAVADEAGNITLDFPRPVLTELDSVPDLEAALGVAPDQTFNTGTLGDILAVFATEQTVRELRPDFAAIIEIQSRTPRPDRGVIATAAADDPSRDYDFVSRFFTPAAGIPEDPATGSAHTALAPYWSGRLQQESLRGLQVSPRTGRVSTRLTADRVHLSGTAVTMADGKLHQTP